VEFYVVVELGHPNGGHALDAADVGPGGQVGTVVDVEFVVGHAEQVLEQAQAFAVSGEGAGVALADGALAVGIVGAEGREDDAAGAEGVHLADGHAGAAVGGDGDELVGVGGA
jgi:hypothetical protein